MQWKDIITQKNKAAITIASIFLLVLTTTLMDKRHLSELQNSLTSVYEDRLVAKSYLSNLSRKIIDKRTSFEQDETVFFETSLQTEVSITTLIKDYEKTQLTPEESLQFEKLKTDIQQLELLESRFTQNTTTPQTPVLKNGLKEQYNTVLSDLESLAAIQLNEGKKIIDRSNQVIASSNLTSRLEIGILIVLGLMIHALLSSQNTIPRQSHMEKLN